MLLAEGPQIDGGLLAMILTIFTAVVVLYVLTVVQGFKAAARLGRGDRSPRAIVPMTLAVIVELGFGLLAGPNPLLALGLALVAAQAVVYSRAKGAPPKS